MKKLLLLYGLTLLLGGCMKADLACEDETFFDEVTERSFQMGFSTWSYDVGNQAFEETYDFIHSHGDIYSEQIDEYIPWKSWINNTSLPEDFVLKMQVKKAQKPVDGLLALSVSLLNTDRDDLLRDEDGSLPEYQAFDDEVIINAYEKHLNYLVDLFGPEYLIFAMEVNDLFIKDRNKWEAYKSFSQEMKSRLRSRYPQLKITESITLHSWFEPETSEVEAYNLEMKELLSTQDFAAISFYPFLKGLRNTTDFRRAFDFLHAHVDKEIAFIETNHLAETLELETFNLRIESDPCEQNEYLEVLLGNAQSNDYVFVIWWAHRDYDALWETFPEEVKDIGKVWRDTGILDENANERIAYQTWQRAFEK